MRGSTIGKPRQIIAIKERHERQRIQRARPVDIESGGATFTIPQQVSFGFDFVNKTKTDNQRSEKPSAACVCVLASDSEAHPMRTVNVRQDMRAAATTVRRAAATATSAVWLSSFWRFRGTAWTALTIISPRQSNGHGKMVLLSLFCFSFYIFAIPVVSFSFITLRCVSFSFITLRCVSFS